MDYSDILDIDKPVSHHKPMDIAHRAKIFAPFAALKGFEACIRQKEIVYYEYPVLSEDQKDSLNQKLQIIQCGQTITVTYGKQFYLMEHQEFHDQSNQVILDGYGKLIIETGKAGFDQQAKQKLHEYVRERQQEHPEEQNNQKNQKNQENPDWQNRMQRYQDKLVGSIQKSQNGSSGGKSSLENQRMKAKIHQKLIIHRLLNPQQKKVLSNQET